MKVRGVFVCMLMGLLIGGVAAAQSPPAVPSRPNPVDPKMLAGSWSGTWRSARGSTGMISVVIHLVDSDGKALRGEFSESGRLITKWVAPGELNDKGEIVFDGADRTDTLQLKAEGLLVGHYEWKTNPSTGTTELRKK
jgi:hypothetical protein